MNLSSYEIDISQKFGETSKLSKSIKERNEDLVEKYYEGVQCLSQVDSDLECVICTDIASDPLECEGCAHIFCRQCVMQWVTKRGTCPFECSQKWLLKIAHPKYLKMLNNLKFICHTCQVEISYQERKNHQHNFIPQLNNYEKQHFLARNQNNYFCKLSEEIEDIINLNKFCKVFKFIVKLHKQFGFKDGRYFINIENPLNMYIEEDQWHNQYSLISLHQLQQKQWFYKSKYPHQWVHFPQKLCTLIESRYEQYMKGKYEEILEYEYAGNIKYLNFKQMVMRSKDSHITQEVCFFLNN